MAELAEWESFYLIVGGGGAALVLLFIGIHNAWDAVSYHVFVNMRKAKV